MNDVLHVHDGLMKGALHVLIYVLGERGETVRTGLGVIFALGATGAVALAAWQVREAVTARRVGNRVQVHDAAITSLVCTGLALELAAAAAVAFY
jgi:hypothetical protein